jgi:hypothetical protein
MFENIPVAYTVKQVCFFTIPASKTLHFLVEMLEVLSPDLSKVQPEKMSTRGTLLPSKFFFLIPGGSNIVVESCHGPGV